MGRALVTGDVPFTGDLLHFHYPLRDFYARALAAHQRVDWMPALFNGFYVVGEGQLGAYHPFHWLLYRLLPLPSAFAVELVAAYPFLSTGTWLWLRRWCADGPAAFGALLFASSGFTLSHGVHPNMVGVIAHLPWLLWAIHGAASSTGWAIGVRWSVTIAVLIASQVLLGHPQAAWIAGLAAAAYAVWLLLVWPGVGRLRAVALVAGGGVLGLVMGAVQLLATLDAAAHSVRATYDASFATEFSLRPAALAQVLQPYQAWGRVWRWNEAPGAGDEYGVYAGAVAMLLGAWWLAHQWHTRRTHPRTRLDSFGIWLTGLGGMGLWLATGGHGGLYLIQTWLPIVGQFRAPVRYVVFAQFAAASLAAVALARLLRPCDAGDTACRRALWAPWGLTAVLVLLTAGMDAGTPRESLSRNALLAAWLGPAIFVTGAVLLTLAARGARWALPLLVLCAAVDQAVYGLGGVIAWHDFVAPSRIVSFLGPQGARPPVGAGRIVRGGFPNLYTLDGYHLVDGYVAITPLRQLRYDTLDALRLSAVSHAHKDALPVRLTPDATLLGGEWLAVADTLPRARLVTRARVSHMPAVDIATIDLQAEALVSTALSLDVETSRGSADITRDDPGDIRVRTRTGGRQLLVVSESYDAGWRATVDGSAVPVARANGDFLGCVVPAGRHEVSLTFSPTHLVVGKRLSLSGLCIAAALVVISAGVRRRASRRVRWAPGRI